MQCPRQCALASEHTHTHTYTDGRIYRILLQNYVRWVNGVKPNHQEPHRQQLQGSSAASAQTTSHRRRNLTPCTRLSENFAWKSCNVADAVLAGQGIHLTTRKSEPPRRLPMVTPFVCRIRVCPYNNCMLRQAKATTGQDVTVMHFYPTPTVRFRPGLQAADCLAVPGIRVCFSLDLDQTIKRFNRRRLHPQVPIAHNPESKCAYPCS